ncbi:tetratricopeptide repeat-containing sensor histidine kinase [Pedobacter glucosidilyticus]|uniref:tetratricopeptide repeat-containing sensor histidine kinase n=1 Tax=Pedobacter glucosidilyticus TaxID=1122941 RepID=UPI0026EFF54B|nr:tetratricopeptide repeat-containing sensor histidine kinase [Pedobacter glucosidilyticus]
MSHIYLILIYFHLLLFQGIDINHYKKVINTSDNDSLVVNAHIMMMKSFGPNKMDSVRLYFNKALYYTKKNNFLIGETILNHNMANLLSVHGDLSEALVYANAAAASAKKQKDELNLARAYGLLTVIYGRKGDFTKSAANAFSSLNIFEKLKNKSGMINAYIKLSAIHIQIHDFKSALKYCKIADSLNKEVKDKDFELDIVNNMAIAFAEQGKLDDALEMFKRVSNLTKGQKSKISAHASALMNIGLVYKEKKEYKKALDYYQQSYKVSLDNNYPEGILKNMQNISVAYYFIGDYDKSNQEALKALDKSREMGVIDLEVEILEGLRSNYLKQQDYKNAQKYTEEYYEAAMKLNVKEREREISGIKDKYELEKTQEQVKLLNQINETRTKQRNLSIILLVIAFLSMIVFAYSYYRIRILNRQNVINKDKLFESNQIKDRIFSIIGHDLRSAYVSTLGILSLIKENNISEHEKSNMIDRVIHQSETALETLDKLLHWGYSQIRGAKITLEDFNCATPIKQTLDFLQQLIQEKRVVVDNQINEEICVLADKNHFNFIIRNLISNAVKFTPNGGKITLKSQEEKDNFKFFITDSGVGIAKARLEKIFTADSSSTSGTQNEKGTGLGLIICKEFIESNGGKIEVNSIEGVGTTFSFTLKKGKC